MQVKHGRPHQQRHYEALTDVTEARTPATHPAHATEHWRSVGRASAAV